MPLTDTTLRNAKPGERQIKLFDGHGLFLLIAPSGTKAWRLKYSFHGKEKLISLELYPTVSLERSTGTRRDSQKGHCQRHRPFRKAET